MKLFISWAFIAGLVLYGCNQIDATIENKTEQPRKTTDSKDKREVTTLIRQVLNWSEPKSILTPPVKEDKEGKFFTSIDLAEHKRNLQKLKAANLFAAEFINNYNQLILTLDHQLKKGSYGPWLVGDSPSFRFTSSVNPWCSCQDVPYDKPNPYDLIQVEEVSLNDRRGELNWKWGKLGPEYDADWKNFKYRFRVVKEGGRWKVAYLEGFDLKAGLAKNF